MEKTRDQYVAERIEILESKLTRVKAFQEKTPWLPELWSGEIARLEAVIRVCRTSPETLFIPNTYHDRDAHESALRIARGYAGVRA